MSDVAPTVDEYLPLPQSVQVPPSGPVWPLLHRQSDNVLLAAGDAEFAGHVSHTEPPAEYLPDSQGTHVECDVAALANE